MTPTQGQAAARVLVIGDDAELVAVLCLHLPRGGYAPVCLPGPELAPEILPRVEPHAVVLVLPVTPSASWGPALTSAASAAQAGVRVVLVAPVRDVVEPLAAAAGAERALSRAEVLARPLSVLDGMPAHAGPPPLPPRPMVAAHRTAGARPGSATAGLAGTGPGTGRTATTPGSSAPALEGRAPIDLESLLPETSGGAPAQTPRATRVEVNVSLVSEHNFFVGSSRRIDSGGVFIATMLPPPVGTPLTVRLGLPDARKLEVAGEVVFLRDRAAVAGRQPPGCGVRLRDLPAWAVEAIALFLAARPPIVHAP